jgi:glycosyltransferase involved in cell wall biosynthesis
MKIVHFIFKLNVGGAENMLVDIANEQAKTSSVAIVIIKEKSDQNILKRVSKNVRLVVLSSNYKNYNLLYVAKLWLFLWRNKPAAIHCHDMNCIPLLPFFLSKTVITVHNVKYNLKYVKLCKRVFAISKSVKEDIDRRSSINSLVVYNGIHFDNVKQRNYLNNNAGEIFKFIQVGRLLSQKGQDIMLQAVAELVYKHKVTNISIDFVGGGNDELLLKDLVQELEIVSYVNFLGPKDRRWVYENLSNYFALVQPSRFEGFGLTVVEAVAAKIPVIAFDVDGPREILTGLPSCYLVPPGNASSFASAMLKAIESASSPQFESNCNKSYEIALSKFSVEKTASNYIQQYRYL